MVNMKITFGIVTAGDMDNRINYIIDSIEANQIPVENYEIIIAGNSNVVRNNTKVIQEESGRHGWITRKKNLICQNAKYETVVLLHDYVAFKPDWYQNMVQFGNDWDVCMNRILNTDDKRFRDWVKITSSWNSVESFNPHSIAFADYNDNSGISNTYVSGTYFVVKRDFMLKHPLNEELAWGQGEDVEWSARVNKIWNYKVNPKSIVYFLKTKVHFPASPE